MMLHLGKKLTNCVCGGGVMNVTFLKGKERCSVYHGGYSQIDCTMRLLHKAQEHPDGMDYYHGISGQDFPCMSNKKFDQLFEVANGRSYMLYDPMEQHQNPNWIRKIRRRTMYYHWQDSPLHYIKFRHKLYSTHITGIWRITLMKLFKRSELPFELNAGWSWFSWNKQVAEYVLNYEKDHPEYFKRFHSTDCCDEVIFHMLLYPVHEQLNLETNNALRYIDWSSRRPRTQGAPQTLIAEDYGRIVKSGAIFCRKIQPIESKELKGMLEAKIKMEA